MLYKDYVNCRYDYQKEGTKFLLNIKHGCLFWKCGKSKTFPCIDAIRVINSQMNGNAKVLILSTANAINNMWRSEIDPQNILPENTVMMSLSKAIRDEHKEKLLSVKWDVIVIDECFKIKSHNSKASKLVYKLTKYVPYVWGLSGTPRGNSDLDIYCQFHNMNIGDWGSISYTSFVNNFCDIDVKYFQGNRIQIPIGINRKYLDFWNKNIEKYTQRIGYDESDAMPDLFVEELLFPFEKTKEYKDAMQGVILLKDYETTMTKLAAIQKLHQIANGYVYILDENSEKSTHFIEHNKKLDWVSRNVGRNVVIVYRFDEDRIQLEKQLTEDNKTCTLDVNIFKEGKADILLLQCSRCESFNLQNCNEIIFYTLDYSYINYEQMIHRIWRKGQTKDCMIKVLLFENSIETKIWDAVKNKKELADLFMSIKGDNNG